MKNTFLLLFLIFTTSLSQSQTIWDKPNNVAKPWTRWWWMGSAVTEKGIKSQLDAFQKAGFGGVQIVPIYGAKGFESQYIPYLSPKWMKMLDFTTHYAESLKMGVDMAVGTGWPIGGPQVTTEDAATNLTVQNYSIESGEYLKEKIVLNDPKQKDLKGIFLISVLAIDQNGKANDVTDKVTSNSTLNWKTDLTGKWQIVAFFNTKTLQKVKRAAPGGEGYTLDHFSSTSLKNYFHTFDTAFGSSAHGVHSFFNDSYEVYNADWTPNFLEEFKKRRGYDLSFELLALSFEPPRELTSEKSSQLKANSSKLEVSSKQLSDYRQTMSELILENFTKDFTNWSHSKGVMNTNQAHGSPGNLLDLYAAVDIPECETFGSSHFDIKGLRRDSADIRNVDPDPVMMKFASSGAHSKNKPLTSCETLTWLTEHFKTSLSQCKPEVEQVFLTGVNHIFYHGSTYSPPDAPFPGWLFYASVNFVPHNSLWNHLNGLNEYITRCQTILQAGESDNEIKAYWPIYDAWNNQEYYEQSDLNLPKNQVETLHATSLQLNHIDFPFAIHSIDKWLHPTPFYKNVVDLQKKGFSIDFVSDKMISDLVDGCQLSVDSLRAPNKLSTVNCQPSTILISECHFMPINTLKNIIKLAENGNTVVIQSLPKDVPGLFKLEEQRDTFKKIISSLKFEKIKNSLSLCLIGKGKIILSFNVQSGLEYAQLRRETLTDVGLKFIRRKVADGKYYYLVNHTANDIDTIINIETPSNSVEILNPQTGDTGLAQSSIVNNSTLVKIKLASGEALFFKTSSNKSNLSDWKYLKPTNNEIALNNEWQLHFTQGGPFMPSDKKVLKLQNWTDFADTSTQSFSGTAEYTTKFFLNKKNGADYELNLGKVNESAKITINGQNAGLVWSHPFKLKIGKYLKQGENSITIEVANLMANRIRYMDQHNMEWRKYHEINFVNINYKPFDASNWKVQPSGLEGPVTIKELR